MQDPAAFGVVLNQGFPDEKQQQQLKCPRCDSSNTKFCYYNNYNLSQPRYYCKSCRRYWTKGGSLRNIPVGGASRKPTKRSAKRPCPSSTEAGNSTPSTTAQGGQQQFGGGSGLIGPNGPGQEANGVARNLGFMGSGGVQLESDSDNNGRWTDLAMYTPDSRFQ